MELFLEEPELVGRLRLHVLRPEARRVIITAAACLQAVTIVVATVKAGPLLGALWVIAFASLWSQCLWLFPAWNRFGVRSLVPGTRLDHRGAYAVFDVFSFLALFFLSAMALYQVLAGNGWITSP